MSGAPPVPEPGKRSAAAGPATATRLSVSMTQVIRNPRTRIGLPLFASLLNLNLAYWPRRLHRQPSERGMALRGSSAVLGVVHRLLGFGLVCCTAPSPA